MEGTRDEAHGIVQPELCEQNMTILGRSTLLLNSKAAEQMTAECWRWCPRWNRLASPTSLWRVDVPISWK